MIKFHGISMPEGAALSWPLSDIVIRRKNGFDFRCRVRGYSLPEQPPVSALSRQLPRMGTGSFWHKPVEHVCRPNVRFREATNIP